MGESQEIKDFTKKTAETKRKPLRKGETQKKSASAQFFDQQTISMLILFFAAATAVVSVLAGVLVFHISAATACIVILLEAAIAACLMEVPVWLHGFVVVVQIAVGIWQKNLIFILLGVLIYLITGYALRYRRRMK